MNILGALETIHSTVPSVVDDADLFPEALRDRISEVENHVHRANKALRAAEVSLSRAEEAFNEAGMTFVAEEVAALTSTQDQLSRIGRALESYRGIRRSRVEDEPIRRERRQRQPAAPQTEPLAPPVE
jgi:hypothetical protein